MAVAGPLTAEVLIVNVPEVAPDAIVRFVGSTALALFDDRATTTPPEGAGPTSVTVPIEEDPPITDGGVNVKLAGTSGLIVRTDETEVIPIAAVIVAEVTAATPDVVIENWAVVAPSATVTLDGVCALALSEDRFTTTPPAGAGPVSVTVPVGEVPLGTELGEIVSCVGTAGTTVKVAVAEMLSKLAVIVGAVLVGTATVTTENVAVVAPAGTVTLVGGTALGSLEVKVTTVPAANAGLLRVTVPVEDVPPVTEVGDRVKLVGAGGVTVSVAVAEAPLAVAVITAFVSATT